MVQGRNENKKENYDVQITKTSKDIAEEFLQLTDMIKDKTKSNFALTTKKYLDLFLKLSDLIENTDKRHLEAVRHVLKNALAVENTLATMKKKVDLVKLNPVMKLAPGENIKQYRKFFSAAK